MGRPGGIPGGGAGGAPAPGLGDATLGAPGPAGLPDETSLARLANELFAALPGAFGRSLQRAQPTAVAAQPAGVAPPGVTAVAAPASVQGASAPGYAVPLQPPSVPDVAPPAIAPPTSPYYFLTDAASHAPLAPGAASFAPHAPEELATMPIPGDDDLAGLVAPLLGDAAAPALASPAAGSVPAFYFLDGGGQAASLPRIDTAHPAFDVSAIRRDFPILAERVNGKPLIWFDNAATTQKPQAVIDRLAHFYAHENSNIHRAAHELAARATDAYEGARKKVARFLGASSPDEIVFVRGATEAVNLVARTFGRQQLQAGDEIILSQLEHHANIVPWQQVAAEAGAKIRVIPVDDRGDLLLDEYQKLLNARTRIVALTQVSNALGTVTPVREIVDLAHRAGAKVLVDGAQAVSHLRVNVQALDADFYVFSGHKVFGPTGIGVVYGKAALLEAMPPYQGGGNMIADVTFEKTVYQAPPARFEAGTGNIADAVGLGAALDYLERIGIENVARYEHDLLVYATHAMATVPGLRPIGTAVHKASVLSFVLAGHSTEEVGQALSREGIAVRAGHHCAQPILRRFGLEATVRPSLAFYNTCAEVDAMVAVLHKLARARK